MAARRRALALLAPFALLLAVRPFAASAAPVAPPRPISEAERAAVQMAADYLVRGPAAFQENLAKSSPLRALDAAAARDEIEVRAGGRTDVKWELRTPDAALGPDVAVFSIEAPSGLDDTVVVRLVKEGEAWRVLWLKSFHEPWLDGKSMAVKPAPRDETPTRLPLVVAVVVGLLAVFLLLLGISFLPDRPVPAGAWIAAGLAAIGALVYLLSGRVPVPGLSGKAPELFAKMRRGTDVERYGKLMPLRRRLEAGEPRDPNACIALAKQNPEAMAQVWIAQRLLATAAMGEARRVLQTLPNADQVPWVSVLRARIAFMEKRDTEAAAAYVTAASQGVLHDGILLEALAVARALGFDRPDLDLHFRLLNFGARSAEARLVLATGMVQDEKLDDAEKAFLAAWKERPIDRETVLGDDDLQEILHRPAILDALQLASALEPAVAADEVGRRAIALPAGVAAWTCGRRLRVIAGSSELHVPAGAELAPGGTSVEDAGAERRALAQRAMTELPTLLADPPQVGAFVQPVLRTRILRTAFILARRNKWAELATITGALKGGDEQVPSDLLMLRAQALRRVGRVPEARQVLLDLAASSGFAKRHDPLSFYELGELFVGIEDYEHGVQMLRKAAGLMKRDVLNERILQVQTEQKLATKFASYDSAHFDVRFPPERVDGFGKEAARVLEAERKRLGKWLPARDDLKTSVQILWLEQFRRTYGAAGDVLGLYDGKIRVPLAGVGRFFPFVVSIVTHELAHALLADLTKDNAPHWFHEGLAQHVEMRRFRPNYIMQYEQQRALLSLPVVETILERFPDPYFVEQAYMESEWAVAYIDAKWGGAGLGRLMAAYRDGLSGDEALVKALGVDMNQLSKDFVAWSLRQPKMLHDEIVAYDEGPDDDFHWSKQPDEPLGKTKATFVPDSLYN